MSKMKIIKKTIEETYQLLTPIEHVLKRPDTYVGSLDKQTQQQWVLNQDQTKFIQKTLHYSPALYKIFDEVLVNAADSYQRDKSMNCLNIQISQENGFVKVHNNGKGIPIVIHQGQDMYVPEMIFGHLFTGSNFDDEKDKRFGGGRNGFGAKLANILSSKFSVECADSQNKKHFFMSWTNNMGDKIMPLVKDYKGKDFVEVKFYPDFKRFGMQKFESDIVQLFKKRAYDMAGVLPKVKVHLNGNELKIKSFSNYVDMYLAEQDDNPPVKITVGKNQQNPHWEVILSRSDGQLKQVSFVNSICTYKGGTHTNYILDQIVPKIADKLKNPAIKTQFIKSKLFIFINCLIVNPKFDSQLKETLTTRPNCFGSTWDMPQKMIKAMLATGIVEELAKEAEARQLTKMAKVTGGGKKSRVDVPKLQDANDAGKKDSDKCVLILTEGDSAKALAVSGLSVLGRDKYGVFPLRGKLLNVRQKDRNTVLNNAEISNIVKIIGLQYNKQYSDLKSLRYGSIMIMTDQDHDGSHIKGLIINFIEHFWPSLFKIKGFLRQFITPLLKVSKNNVVESFFSTQEYIAWKNATANSKSWKVKYYKGLGTSTSKEGQQYFKNINTHEKTFTYENNEDVEKIDLAFSKKKADQRKTWLATYDPEDILQLTPAIKDIRYRDFVDKQLIHFSNSNNKRAIPSVIDGLKPGQRKIIYSCFKRNLKQEIKVAQLAGYVAEHSAYHHGEMSLTQTIIMLAQNYCGANNINLMMPNGQFGSRAEGGSDHASARYIFTCLNKVTRVIFPQDDDHTLKYTEDDGQIVQPQFYIPVIPMLLVNGVQGLGTGWSTNVPNYNPRQLVQQMRKKLRGEDFTPIFPWYKGFQGQIVEIQGGFKTRGIVSDDANDRNTIHVTQLPIGKWNVKFKQELVELIKKQKYVVGFKQHHTEHKVHFEIEMTDEYMMKQDALQTVFTTLKLSTSKRTTNMVAFNAINHIQKYASPVQIMQDFFAIRLRCYKKRKQYLISKIKRQVEISSMKVKFIQAVINNKIQINNVPRQQLCKVMEKDGYIKFSQFTKVKSTKKGGEVKQKQEGDQEEENNQSKKRSKTSKQNQEENKLFTEYNYLLGMPLWSLTAERAQKLRAQLEQNQKQQNILMNTKQTDMWLKDLDNFLLVLDEVEQEQKIQRNKSEQLAKGVKGKNKKIGKRIKKIKNKDSDEDISETQKEKKPKRDKSQSSTKSDTTKVSNEKSKGKKPNKKKDKSQSIGKLSQSSKESSDQNKLAKDTPFKQIVKGVNSSKNDKSQNPSKLTKPSSKPKVSKKQQVVSAQDRMKSLFTKFLGKGTPQGEKKQTQKQERAIKKLVQIGKEKEKQQKSKDAARHQPRIQDDDDDFNPNTSKKPKRKNPFDDDE